MMLWTGAEVVVEAVVVAVVVLEESRGSCGHNLPGGGKQVVDFSTLQPLVEGETLLEK